jgi:hypothetical protein
MMRCKIILAVFSKEMRSEALTSGMVIMGGKDTHLEAARMRDWSRCNACLFVPLKPHPGPGNVERSELELPASQSRDLSSPGSAVWSEPSR